MAQEKVEHKHRYSTFALKAIHKMGNLLGCHLLVLYLVATN